MTVVTLAYGWRLERSDGVTLGFTSHDRDLWRDGLLYRARPGLLPGKVSVALGLDDDGVDLSAALGDAAIRADDLIAGRWDAARLSLCRLDWADVGAAPIRLVAGELGEVTVVGDAFRAELRGAAALLDAPVVPATSPGCRASFCGAECGLSAARFTHEAMVTVSDDEVLTVSGLPPMPDNAFAMGHLRWMDGANTGLVQPVVASDSGAITLAEAPPVAPSLPARVELREGCDRAISTCHSRFGNSANFRGEPWLPGNDLLTRYPGAA